VRVAPQIPGARCNQDAAMDIDLKQLREIMRAFKQFDLQELVVEKGDERIKLVRGAVGGVPGGVSLVPAAPMQPSLVPPPPPVAPSAPTATSSGPGPSDADDASIAYVTSPFVGTFYRAPSPDAPPFVEVGSTIRPGQTLCIVEAMKLMNEIEAEFAGTILEVIAENGKPVEYGDRLFKVKKA
jgi:acetyl-CoA carboxylase biotin carboxyl carrier protein